MRRCRRCAVDLPYNGRGRPRARCAGCAAKDSYDNYQNWRGSRIRFLEAVKITCGCVDCGTRDGLLDFDHRPGTTREFYLRTPYRWARLLAELEKCDVRCRACHSRRHGVERGGLNEGAVAA